MYDLHDYLSPVNVMSLNNDKGYSDSQLGNFIKVYHEQMPDLHGVDIVIAGINEFRGDGFIAEENAADARQHSPGLYAEGSAAIYPA